MMKIPHRPDLDVVALDFETYFDKDYSLRKMATSSYVRDPRFKVQSVAVYYDGETHAYPDKLVARALEQIPWERTAVLCHHTQFDGLILTHHFGHVPAYYLDTLSMARALHGSKVGHSLDDTASFYRLRNKLPDILGQTKGIRDLPPELMGKLLAYNEVDVEILVKIFQRMHKKFPATQFDLVDLTVSLFTEPVLEVDRELCEKEIKRETRKQNKLLKDLKLEISQLTSREQFADLLREAGVKPPMKPKRPTAKNPNPKGETYAFAKNDLEFIALETHPKERVRKLTEARKICQSNIAIARPMALLDRTQHVNKLPIYLNAYGAHTLRFSGGDGINPQNFPDPKKGLDSQIRRALRAPKGYVIVVVDASQIEARYNGWFCEQDDLLEAFADSTRDPYKEMASEIYDLVVEDIDGTRRFVGKVAVLGLGYQMGAPKFQYTLATGQMGPPVYLEIDLCEKTVYAYRRRNYKIANKWRVLNRVIESSLYGGHKLVMRDCVEFEKGRINMPNGLSLLYPNLKVDTDGEYPEWHYKQRRGDSSKLYGGKLLENIIQCLSLIHTSEAMLELCRDFRLVSMSHDEVIFLAKESEADAALKYALEVMSKPPSWSPDIPLAAEGGYDVIYSK